MQPGVVLQCLLRTPRKQGFVEGSVWSREDNIVWSAHEDIAFSSGVHTKEYCCGGVHGLIVVLPEE